MSLINQVIDKVHECFDKCNMSYDYPMIHFKKKGRTAGTANYNKWVLNFNKTLLEENPETFINQTVPHECAHLIAFMRYNKPNRYHIKPHGREWKYVMYELGANPKRCHSYDTSNSAVYHKSKYLYKCGCQNHIIGPTVHKRIQRENRTYSCNVCKTLIVFQKNCGKVSYNQAMEKV